MKQCTKEKLTPLSKSRKCLQPGKGFKQKTQNRLSQHHKQYRHEGARVVQSNNITLKSISVKHTFKKLRKQLTLNSSKL